MVVLLLLWTSYAQGNSASVSRASSFLDFACIPLGCLRTTTPPLPQDAMRPPESAGWA